MEIRANDLDVQRYLEANMSKLPSFVSRDPHMRAEVIARILEAADGM